MYMMLKIFHFSLLAFLCGTISSFAFPPWSGRLGKWHSHHSHHDYECKHDPPPQPHVYPSPGGEQGCSCLLLVGERKVFGRDDESSWYSCSPLGLYRCAQFCDELFQDENLRYRSRQDACDVIGQEISTPWYRKNQVCGAYGPYENIPLSIDLCCRRGRPSGECAEV